MALLRARAQVTMDDDICGAEFVMKVMNIRTAVRVMVAASDRIPRRLISKSEHLTDPRLR